WKDYPMLPITNGIHIKTWDKVEVKENIWVKHVDNKRSLLEYIKKVTGEKWDEKTLLLGWARRLVRYKRPLVIFENLQKFKDLAVVSDRPIKVVIAGIAHENDVEGTAVLEQIHKFVTE